MKEKVLFIVSVVGMLVPHTPAQSLLFDFDSAPAHVSLPITLTVGGVTAQFSATGQGFSIQPANSMGFTPVGFAGNCIYPNSIYAADLFVNFSQALTDFSILYAPQELACDSSARMRVTAYLDGVLVGTATTNAQPGTWPSETLAISSSQGFNRVVVHYDAPPPTGGDWGPIFMADNMMVTPAPPPIILTGAARLASGTFRFAFTSAPNATFSILASTNLLLPMSQWTFAGNPNQVSPGQYEFIDAQPASGAQRFYCVHSL